MAIVETESLSACLIFAVVSGILLTFSVASTAYPAYIDRKAEESNNGCVSGQDNIDEDDESATDHEYSIEDTKNRISTPSVANVEGSTSACSSIWASQKDSNSTMKAESLERIGVGKVESFEDDTGALKDTESEHDNSSVKETYKKMDEKISKKVWILAYASHLTFAIFGGIATLVGSWYGPISLFNPLKQVSQILSSMIMFSFILKTEEKPSKETSVGNFIIAVSTILLIFVGAEVRKEPIEIEELFDNDLSIFYGAVLLFLAIFITFPFQFILGFTNAPCLTDRVNFIFLLITEAVHAVVATSASKMIPLLEGRWTWFSLDIVLMVVTILTSAYSAFLRSTVILSQNAYMPLMLSTNVILNCITGLIVWNDQIQNVGGYVCSYLFFVLGVYLITDYEIRLNKQGEFSLVHKAIVETTFLHQRASESMEERSIRQKRDSFGSTGSIGANSDSIYTC